MVCWQFFACRCEQRKLPWRQNAFPSKDSMTTRSRQIHNKSLSYSLAHLLVYILLLLHHQMSSTFLWNEKLIRWNAVVWSIGIYRRLIKSQLFYCYKLFHVARSKYHQAWIQRSVVETVCNLHICIHDWRMRTCIWKSYGWDSFKSVVSLCSSCCARFSWKH